MPLPQDLEASPRRLLRDEVYTSILDAIIDGTLHPGETLRDEDLISWLGVSRTPIRQALNRLADIGLVDMAAGKITKVAEFDAALVNQSTYVTGILHEFSIRKTTPTLSQTAIRELDQYVATIKRAVRGDDVTVIGPAIRDFFRVFHRESGNEEIDRTVEHFTPMLLRFLTPRENLRPLDEILHSLTVIAAAAKAHDTTAAVEELHQLYTDTREAFLSTYRPKLRAR